jgi:hypothetical protein
LLAAILFRVKLAAMDLAVFAARDFPNARGRDLAALGMRSG